MQICDLFFPFSVFVCLFDKHEQSFYCFPKWPAITRKLISRPRRRQASPAVSSQQLIFRGMLLLNIEGLGDQQSSTRTCRLVPLVWRLRCWTRIWETKGQIPTQPRRASDLGPVIASQQNLIYRVVVRIKWGGRKSCMITLKLLEGKVGL